MTNLFKHAKHDLLASVVVFLVALPLCLGIALASGAPLLSGIISGVVGGIVIGALSKSQLSVSGPAAGLVVIVLTAIDNLGSFQAFLLAVVIAGILQVVLGFIKAGVIGLYFPSSVIKGMLAAIGLILILKQIPHLVGFDADSFSEMQFLQADGSNTFSYLLSAFDHILMGSFIIGGIALLILVLWERPLIKKSFFKQVPGGLVAVIIAILLNETFVAIFPQLAISGEHLVSLPEISAGTLSSMFMYPDLSLIMNPTTYFTAITIAIIASLETLLSVEAIDKLDPQKRRTPQNTELKAQGIGNIICGLVGGLPVTAVIVRSSTNLDAGAKTKMAAIYHGVILLVAVALIPALLNKIPLASLAAVLIIVGYKLTKPMLYKHQFKLGRRQFIPFISTVVAILFTDLLVGILIGMAIGVFYILKSHYKAPYLYDEEKHHESGKPILQIRLNEHVSFLNKARLQKTLEELPPNSKVLLDGTPSKEIDHDALEIIHNFKNMALEKNISFQLKNIPELQLVAPPKKLKHEHIL